MPVKLIVKSIVDASYASEFTYGQARITIGRDSGNLLALPDDKRILSKEHAEIRVEGEQVCVVDLGSKNFTYLNGERLQGHQPAALESGDVLRLGDYEVQVVLLEVPAPPPAPSDDRTVFAFNPFWEPAAQLREVIQQVRKTYAREVPERRREALREALGDALEEEASGEVASILAEVLGGSAPAEAAGAAVRPELPVVPERSIPRPQHSTGDAAPAGRPAVVARSPERAALDETAAEMLLRYVAGLLGIPWQFRHEFIGQTIMQSEATAVLYDGDADALRDFLLDPDLTEEEAARRRTLFAEAAEALRLHQVALLDGYKASVQQGIQRFLDEVDLDRIEQDAAADAKWYEKPMTRQRAIEQLQQKVQSLRQEDWTTTERRVFRPAFIKAYLARMTSVPR